MLLYQNWDRSAAHVSILCAILTLLVVKPACCDDAPISFNRDTRPILSDNCYADTSGYHCDENISVWPYRDYVMRAFNDNMPFDRFTRENLAGDLLPNATPEQRVSWAFNRLNQTAAEGGAQAKAYLGCEVECYTIQVIKTL